MFEGIKRSWELMKKSFHVLTLDKELLIFPLVAGICSLIVTITFFFPLLFFNLSESILFYVFIFGFYVVIYFVTIFFNSALIGAANIRLNGGDPTLSDGINIALKHLPSIAGWALIAGTVGLILNTLARKTRGNFLGRLLVGIIGGAWNIITFFVIPVMVIEDKGPLESIKRSTDIVKSKFSEAIIGSMGFGLITFLITILAIVLFIGITFGLSIVLGGIGLIIGVVLAVLVIVMISLVSRALNAIFVATLYNYAKTGKEPEGWNLTGVLNSVKR